MIGQVKARKKSSFYPRISHAVREVMSRLSSKMKSKRGRNLLLALVVSTTLLISPFAYSLIFPEKASASWFNEQWRYRQSIDISGNSSDLTDYQFKVSGIDTQSLFTSGKLQGDCEDIRFTDIGGNLLDYWVEESGSSCSASSSTNIWVKVPIIPSSGARIYMYYGNSDAVGYTGGSGTFEYFDDFEINSWYNSSWSFRKKLTIKASQVDESLTDFPVYVDLADLGADFFADVKSDGSDIVITDDSAVKLDRELVSIDTGLETGELWFRASALSDSDNSKFYIYYGNASASETNSTGVWSNGFAMVQHMNNDPSSSSQIDSTSNANNGTHVGSMNASDLVSGRLGNAIAFDGSNDIVDISNSASLQFNTASVTKSFWINTPTVTHSAQTHGMGNYKTSTHPHFNAYLMGTTDTAPGAINLGTRSGVEINLKGSTRVDGGNWNLVTIVIDRTNTQALLYINGELDDSTSIAGLGDIDSGQGIYIGSGHLSRFAEQTIDEARIQTGIAQSAGWVKTEYNNQSATASFYSVGNMETPDAYDFRLWETQVSPEVTGGELVLSDASGNEEVESIETFAVDSQVLFRAKQASTTFESLRGGFTNTNNAGGGILDDDAAILEFRSGVENYRVRNANESATTVVTGSIAEDADFHVFGIGYRSGAVDYTVDGALNTTQSSNAPDENMYIRFLNQSTTEAFTFDWVAVSKYSSDPPDTQVLGNEEETPGAIVHLDFSEDSGTIAFDQTGYGNDGTLRNDPTRVNLCPNGSCLSFDGSNDHVDLGLDQFSNSDVDNAAISLWFNASQNGVNQFIFDFEDFIKLGRDSATSTNLNLFLNDGSSKNIDYGSDIPLHSWNHFVGTWDDTTMYFYLNGEEIGTVAISAGPDVDSQSREWALGSRYDGAARHFGGAIDEFKFWPRSLTPEEALSEYNRYGDVLGTDPNELENESVAGLIGWWKMDELGGTTAVDSSDSGNDGTYINSPTLTAGEVGNAREFNGSNQYVTFPDSSDTAFTYAARFKVDNVTGNKMILQTSNALFRVQGDDYYIAVFDGRNGTGAVYEYVVSSSIVAGQWYHVALTVSASDDIYVYENGVEIFNTSTLNSSTTGDYTSGRIGIRDNGGSPSDYFDGTLDEVKLFDFALSEAEVISDSNGTLGQVTLYGNPFGNPLQKIISLTDPTPELEYQIKVVLNTSNFDYTEARNDGGDIRFSQTNGIVLDYWVEDWNYNGTSTFWVEVADSGETEIIMSFGAQALTSNSNGTATFLYFNDFSTDPGVVARSNDPWYVYHMDIPDISIQNTAFDMSKRWTDIDNSTFGHSFGWMGYSNFEGALTSNADIARVQAAHGLRAQYSTAQAFVRTTSFGFGDFQINTYNVQPNIGVTHTITSEIDSQATVRVFNRSSQVEEGAVSFSYTNITATIFQLGGLFFNNGAGVVWDSVNEEIDYDFLRTGNTRDQGVVDDLRIRKFSDSFDELADTIGETAPSNQPLTQMNEITTADQPVLHLKFDEKSGTTAEDASGNGYNGTLMNMDPGTDWVRGKIGSALDFDGVDDHVDVGSIGNVYGLSFWMKPDATITSASGALPAITFVDASGNSNDIWLALGSATSSCTGEIITIMNTTSNNYRTCGYLSGDISTQWHHVALRWNTSISQYELYFDGVKITTNSGSQSHQPLINATDLKIATRNSQPDSSDVFFNFQVDNLKVWDTSIDNRDVALEYNQGAPVAHWKFDQGEGLTAYNYSLNGMDGTLTNMDAATDWVEGFENSALDFDGGNDYVSVSATSDLDWTEELSISAWINTDSVTTRGTIFARDSTATGYLTLEVYNNGQILFESLDSSNTYLGVYGSGVNIGEWYHVVATRSGITDTMNVYVNGVLAGSVADTRPGNFNFSGISIGALDTGSADLRHFDGKIDEVKVFNYVLTSEDISRDYNLNSSVYFKN